MNYTYESLEVGHIVSKDIRVTKKTINDFAKVSGDFNPIHVDEEFAKNSKFGKIYSAWRIISIIYISYFS